MRVLAFILILFFLVGCNQHTTENKKNEAIIDSLKQQLAATYKPGFGEFMSGIQMHHAKLWFAGQNKNWELADFEIHEIGEALEYLKKFCTDRPETKSLAMINAPMDSIIKSVEQKNPALFNSSFTLLTNTCNNCHIETKHGFNKVIIPIAPPVTNQDFKPVQ